MRHRTRRMDNVTIEIAPLIDIVFILLIFFVVTSTFIRENVLELELPNAVTSTMPLTTDTIDVLITADNVILVNEQPLPESDWTSLVARLKQLGADPETHDMVIRADARSRHETVVVALDAAQALGITQIKVVTVKQHG